jgi:hypothetical protein
MALVLGAGPVIAQGAPPDWPGLKSSALSTVYVLDDVGRETSGKLLRFDRDALVLLVGGTEERIEAARVKRIARRGDSLKNGAIIGAVIGVGMGLLSAGIADCVDDQGHVGGCGSGRTIAIVAMASGVYASIGTAIDALNVGRTTIYESPNVKPGTSQGNPPGPAAAYGLTLRIRW